MNLEIPKKFRSLINNAHQVAMGTFRPISRHYDRHEHERPKELDMLASILDGFNEGDPSNSAGAATTGASGGAGSGDVRNGSNMAVCLGAMELCYGDVALMLSLPRQGLGNAAIKSFVVEWGTPGMELARLEKKLGIRASDTAAIHFQDCRVPAENLLGSPEIDTSKGFAGAMQTFDNTRPLVAAMAVGCGRAALERLKELLADQVNLDYGQPVDNGSAVEAEIYRMEAEWEAAYWLTVRAAWMADNHQPNSVQASMCKAKAGRVGNSITLRCAELAGSLGYSEEELLEKWARDSKILDIFEGTQQIQNLIIARRLLGLSSSELR